MNKPSLPLENKETHIQGYSHEAFTIEGCQLEIKPFDEDDVHNAHIIGFFSPRGSASSIVSTKELKKFALQLNEYLGGK